MLLDAALLIEKNFKKNQKRLRTLSQDGIYYVECQNKEQTSLEIFQVLSEIHSTIKVYGARCHTIVIYIHVFNPRDKLVYILLESILYTLVNTYHKAIDLRIGEFKDNINTQGWWYTIPRRIVEFGFDEREFNLYFQNDFSKNHYRKVLTDPYDVEAPARLVTDIKTFLDRFHMKDEFDGKLAYTIGELTDNALCHAKSPCLIDIDITEEYTLSDSEGVYYAVNVVILNFSEKLLYDDIIKKIEHKYYKEDSRYTIVQKAYQKHSERFCRNYKKEDFYMISAFQDEISGRPNESYSGGTGLPELVRTLEEFADKDFCYVLSGKNSLLFQKELLNFTKEGWIGFNQSGNYLEDIPDLSCLSTSYTHLPGTGYNFMLVFKGELDEE